MKIHKSISKEFGSSITIIWKTSILRLTLCPIRYWGLRLFINRGGIYMTIICFGVDYSNGNDSIVVLKEN